MLKTILKQPLNYSLLISGLISGSLLLVSCDSSSSLVNEFNLFDEEDGATTAISGMGVHPDFQHIVDRFVVEAEKRNVRLDLDGLDIQYGNTGEAYGVCSFLGTDTKDILMSTDLKNANDELVSEIVIHELGHCILGREHSSNPRSIMHATRIIGQPWRASVLDELFR